MPELSMKAMPAQPFVDLPLQVLHQAFDTMVVDVPRQGDGEHAVMGGVGNSHRENPLSFEGG